MSRYYRQLALLFFALFAVAMLLIRAQPYDDHELRALLMPDDCEMPCFMGIRPGVTTVDEAVKILENSGWVNNVYQDASVARWSWNGKQPSVFLLQSEDNEIVVDYDNTKDAQIVGLITVDTSIPVGYVYLLFGDTYLTDSGASGLRSVVGAYVSATYVDHFVNIGAIVPCPVTRVKFLHSPMIIDFMSDFWIHGKTGYSNIDFFC